MLKRERERERRMNGTAKTILVTGSSDGIGKQTALDLVRLGHKIILHGRSRDRTMGAMSDIARETGGGKIYICIGDFSSLDSVKDLAEDVKERFERIDVIINNAGVYIKDHGKSADGYELTLAINHLAPFVLTLLLLEPLSRAPAGRIVNFASQAHASDIDFSDLNSGSGYGAYALSKLCNIMFTLELAERLKGPGVTVNCLHPGVIATKLLHAAWSGGSPVTEGSVNSVFCALSEKLQGVTGRYIVNKREAAPPAVANDTEARLRLWKMSEEMTGVRWDDVVEKIS